MATARAIWVLFVIIVLTVPLIPFQLLFNALNLSVKRTLPLLWHRIARRIIDLKVSVKGDFVSKRPLLLVANHISWLDIIALASVAPVSFIAKSEVASWPGVGVLAGLQRTVFVRRALRSKTGQKADEISRRLREGDVLVLFAEGTSTDGSYVLPFRSALLGGAQRAVDDNEVITIQPVALAYTGLHGLPSGYADRAVTGFYGDMDMAPHLWDILKRGAVDVTISFGTEVIVDDLADRKELASLLEKQVRGLKTAALRNS